MNDADIKTLRDKCLLFNQFMIEKSGMPLELAGLYKQSNELIEKSYLERNIKPLKIMSTDIDNQVAKDMPLPMALELKALFKEILGLDFEAAKKARLRVIEKILKKGKIASLEEYDLLLDRVEEIYSDNSKKDEVGSINGLLANFHNKTT